MADPVNAIVKEIPFAELVRKAALAIADGQTALDLNSVQTAQVLADMKLDPGSVILAIVEYTDKDGNITKVETLTNDKPLSLLAYGVVPTFYEFTQTIIDLRFWVRFWVRSTHVESSSDFNKKLSTKWTESRTKYGGGGGLSLNLGFFSVGGGGGYKNTEAQGSYEVDLHVSSHTAYDSQVYGLDAAAACRLTTTLKPKPAPARAVPQIITKPQGTPSPS
uniref:DUF2589 domain-containing protein n=1 Tax=Caldisericum exile TaxID=693075 RepID=A0A7C4Y457_9BACT